MNLKDKNDRVFEYLRSAEPELSKDQVKVIIQRLPKLPIPKGGHPASIGFNFNYIVMNTLLVVSIISGLLFFNQVEDIPQSQVPELPGVEIIQNEEAIVEDIPQVVAVSPQELEKNSSVKKVQKEQKTAKQVDNRKDKVEAEVSTSKEIKKDDSLTEIIPISRDKQISSEIEPKTKESLSMGQGDCDSKFKVEGKMPELKRTLISSLRSDGLYDKERGNNRLWFPKEGIAINDKLIPASLQNKYKKLLGKFNIIPCAQRLVEIRREYIAAGDMKGGYFRGSMHGSVDLDELNQIRLDKFISKE